MKVAMKQTAIASGIALAFGASAAHAVGVNDIFGDASFSTNHANFTMLSALGATVGGTNNVNMVWDGDGFNASSDYTGPGSYSNVTAASTTAFFGHNWTAHDIQVFVPGSYSFDTALAGGNPEAGLLNVTVPAGFMGLHMLFDWNGNNNIDVFVVAAPSSVFGTGAVRSADIANCDQTASASAPAVNCLWDGASVVTGFKPVANQVWMLASTDGNSDGIMGVPMAVGGPFAGFNANFNASLDPGADIGDIPAIPVPAAVWLFGSGLLGLVGVARRKKSA
jgi:hypothetical protein